MRTIVSYAQAGLLSGGALSSAYGLGANLNSAVAAGTVVMGSGIALMAFERLNQLRQSRLQQSGLSQNRAPISDGDVQNDLKVELSDRYAILGEPQFLPLRDKMASNILGAWVAQGRLADPKYPQLRGCVTEALIESEVAKLVAKLEGGAGTQQHLREGLQADRGNRAGRWNPVNVEEAAASALKKWYPVFENADYAGARSGLAKKVVEEWASKGSPALMDKPGPAKPLVDAMAHSQIKGFIGFLAGKNLNDRQKTLLDELRKSVRARALEPWKALLLPGALAVGVALVAAAGLRSSSPQSVEGESSPVDPTEICRRTFAADRFSARPEKPLPVPSRMAFVPAWMTKDAKAQQAWILTRFVPVYLDYFECRWTERLDLAQGLKLMDEVQAAWPGTDPVEIPARIEGEAKPGVVAIASDVFRGALEDKILKKYPELSLHRSILEARKKDAQRGVRGEDIPQVGRTIDYEGYSYANLGTRIVRWPQGSQKIAMEKELWDAAKGEWVKCLPKEAK